MNKFNFIRPVFSPLQIVIFPPILNTPSIEPFYILSAKFKCCVSTTFIMSVRMKFSENNNQTIL